MAVALVVAGTGGVILHRVSSGSVTGGPVPPAGPVLVIRPGPPASDEGDERRADDRAMSLAVASLSRPERAEVLAAMTYAAARLESSLTPFGEDLGDGDPIEELEQTIALYAPVLNGARAFEAGRWRSADLDVRVASACPPALPPGEACVSVWSERGAQPGTQHTFDGAPAALGARARFLAWSVSHARILGLRSEQEARDCAEALRERRRRDSSAMSLVLTKDDLELRPVPERDDLQRAARRLGAAIAASERRNPERLEALGRAAPAGHVTPWLDLDASMVLVVPRLSALARLGDLSREVEEVHSCRAARRVRGPEVAARP